MTKHEYKLALIIVAHPDDETLFFSSVPLRLAENTWVICVTDGNGDGKGLTRQKELRSACDMLGVQKTQVLGYKDQFEKRLDISSLASQLSAIVSDAKIIAGEKMAIFTHGPIGEYMHPHHQDVCLAVRRSVTDDTALWVPAYNCFSEKTVILTQTEYAVKTSILTEIYRDETNRFLNLIPATSSEGFTSISCEEVEEIYGFLTKSQDSLHPSKLDRYAHLKSYLETKVQQNGDRLF